MSPSSRRPSALVGLLLAAAALGAIVHAGCRKGGGTPGKDRPLRIAVVPKATNMEFWRTVHAGAVKGERDVEASGVKLELVWKGPLREDDREQQVQVVESFASQGVDGIVLAPLDEKALVRPVEEAKRLGIPTVVISAGGPDARARAESLGIDVYLQKPVQFIDVVSTVRTLLKLKP